MSAATLRLPARQKNFFELRDELKAQEPEPSHVHSWTKYVEMIRRNLTPAQERKLGRYNELHKAQPHQPPAAYFITKECACGVKDRIDYQVNFTNPDNLEVREVQA